MGSLKSGIYSTNKIDYLQRCFPKLKDIKWDHRRKLVGILNDVFLDGGGKKERINGTGLIRMTNCGKISHNIYEGYCNLHSRWLRRKFRAGKFNEYVDRLGCMDVIDDYIYARKGGFGKGYRLTEEWDKVFEDFYSTNEISETTPTNIVDQEKGHKIVPPKNNNAIRSRDANNNNAKSDGFIPFSIPVNQDCLRYTLQETQKLFFGYRRGRLNIKSSINSERLERIFDQVGRVYHTSYSDILPIGEIPQVYVESQSGRLYGRGLSLQNCIREIKYAAMAGLHLKELDISNCHFSIIHQLATKNNVRCDGIKSYLENKSAYRKELAQDIFAEEIREELISQEDAIKVIKKCILSSAYGSKTKNFKYNYWDRCWDGEKNAYVDSDYEEPALVEDLSVGGEFDGQEKAILLSEHEIYKNIAEDIEKATESILGTSKISSSGKGKSYINAMGKAIPVDAKSSKIVAHILQGIESRMLNIVLESCPGKMAIPTHDGFTVDESVDPRKLEEEIRERTGYSLNIHTECHYRSITEEDVIESIIDRAT